MWTLGPVAFAAPWVLAALILLPALWFLLRVTPPAPRRMTFPALRLLLGLQAREDVTARTPWWLILLRLLIVVLVIVGLARPLLNPVAGADGGGPLLLVVDDGWASAADWSSRRQAALDLVSRADREGRPVQLLTTAPPPDGDPMAAGKLGAAAELRPVLQSLTPNPWPVDHEQAREVVQGLSFEGSASVVWLSDGLETQASAALAGTLQRLGSLTVLTGGSSAVLLDRPEREGDRLLLTARRAAGDDAPERTVAARVLDAQGRGVARAELTFASGETIASARADVPADLLNAIGRVDLEGVASAGAVVLLDDTWRRRPVGLASGSPMGADLPLLGDIYYLERALDRVAETRQGSVETLLDRPLAMLAIADSGPIEGAQARRLSEWVEAGGVLVRFAGIRLEQNVVTDPLLPVRLRGGGRQFGGTLTWSDPVTLAPFPDDSPFAGLRVPDDVSVSAQVLAEPSPSLPDKTWARLTDGTPLVTAEPLRQGWVVLFHTTANAEWSSLPLSGLFPAMMERLLSLSPGVAGAEAGDDAGRPLPPLSLLDAFGRLSEPPGSARAVTPAGLAALDLGPAHPPGYYGTPQNRRAVNLVDHVPPLQALSGLPRGVERATVADIGREVELRPWLLLAALILALVDWVVSYALRGLSPRPPRRIPAPKGGGSAAALMLAAGLSALLAFGPGPVRAQEDAPPADPASERALEAVLDTRLAWVRTGDSTVDDMTEAGMRGLTRVLAARSSAELAEPMAVDPETDRLLFFPMIYWPVTEGGMRLSVSARVKVNDYLRHGGMILFDTRETPPQDVQATLAQFDIPSLVRLPEGHVVTRSFYLLSETPGRYADVTLWVEPPGGGNDGVSSVIIGNGDWAAAWARSPQGAYLAPVVPGGERQREVAYRFGVNLVMYALTGNYKADQVHLPAIMERLTQ
ncbi:DUF4159 domain-containing protein [Caenispirillum salinarum]|uniref:DUF4159 domain-containing protein n=1 Tax=Caenispirillum salinarum TaxID=859058 RepID=UPI00384D7E5D